MNSIMGLFQKTANKLEKGGISTPPPYADDTAQCPCCKRFELKKKIARNKMVCPKCGYHYRVGARSRLTLLTDAGSFTEMFGNVTAKDALSFPGYRHKLLAAKSASGEKEAVLCGEALIRGQRCAVFAMDPKFMMGSMGSAVGERLARLFEYATEQSLPVVGFTASGGARMQEGILSLMQMAKVSGAVQWHSKAGNLYITVLTDPTTGGVTASFAMLGDIILAEPKALVGFAGKRVIEQTTKRKLPPDFQSAEFLLSHGFADSIVPRNELRDVLEEILKIHSV